MATLSSRNLFNQFTNFKFLSLNPFVYFGSIICISPLVGYACFKTLRVSFLKTSFIAVIGCAGLYLICLLSGLRSPGEEGDYTLFAILFLLCNILIFQLLRLGSNRLAYAVFVFFFSGSSIVVGLQVLITASYLFYGTF